MENRSLSELQDKIKYHFHNEKLLRQAVTHSSYANEQKIRKLILRVTSLASQLHNDLTGLHGFITPVCTLIVFVSIPKHKRQNATAEKQRSRERVAAAVRCPVGDGFFDCDCPALTRPQGPAGIRSFL